MCMTWIWSGMVVLSVICGLVLGRGPEVAAAAAEGAGQAVELTVSLTGMLCLWSGIMEVVSRSGLGDKLAGLLSPVLNRLFPDYAGDREVMDCIAANVSANMLGLGSAATPLGIRAVQAMKRGEEATDGMCMLVVCNTASIQLIPATVGAVRLAAGCRTPFDILPAVWLASVLSVAVGIGACLILRRAWRA